MATIRIRQGLSIVQEPKDAAQEPDITVPAITALPAVLGVPFS